MKTTLTILAFTLVVCFKSAFPNYAPYEAWLKPDPPEPTRAAMVISAVDSIEHLFTGLKFSAWRREQQVEEACRRLGVELQMHGLHQKLWGCTNGTWIRMYLPATSRVFMGTFFHEVGHVVMRHPYVDLPEDVVEGEANAIAALLLDRYGMTTPDSRKSHYCPAISGQPLTAWERAQHQHAAK